MLSVEQSSEGEYRGCALDAVSLLYLNVCQTLGHIKLDNTTKVYLK